VNVREPGKLTVNLTYLIGSAQVRRASCRLPGRCHAVRDGVGDALRLSGGSCARLPALPLPTLTQSYLVASVLDVTI